MKNSLKTDSKDTKHCNFTGPENIRLFTSIDIPSTFLALHSRQELQVDVKTRHYMR